MISVEEADKIIRENTKPFLSETRPLQEALGAILHEDIFADRDWPPFNKALMDGIAINFTAFQNGTRTFKIEGMQAAGMGALTLKAKDGCTEIMTGAVLTNGCDCIIPVESLQIKDGEATITAEKVESMQHIRPKGADHSKEKLLLTKGTRLLAPQIALAASVGKSQLKVAIQPKVVVISTGDELVDVNVRNIEPYQIRKSNSYFIKSLLDESLLFETDVIHLKDNKKAMRKAIEEILKNFDVVVLTGGVSMGKKDFVPEVLNELGAEVLFHKVKQRPGKPFWFGRAPEGQPIFALPGNPVSTQVGARRYVLPHLKRALKAVEDNDLYAVLTEDVFFKSNLTYFLQVCVSCNDHGQLQAVPLLAGSSGDMAASATSDGFVELPPDDDEFASGYVARFFPWHN